MSCCNSTCESLKQCELPSIKHTTQIKQIKEQWQTRLIHYPTIIHQLFMTKALFYVKTAPGYWVRCYLVYPSLGAAVTACHKLTRADAEPPPTPPTAAQPCDGGCAVATLQHSVVIPASLNLSVRDHINSTCHALLIGWDGKYGYPHQYLMKEGGRGRRKGERGRVGGVKGRVVGVGWKAGRGTADNLFPSPTSRLEAWQLLL